MNKVYKLFIVLMLVAMILPACASAPATEAPAAEVPAVATEAPVAAAPATEVPAVEAPAADAPKDYSAMTWDQIIEIAKAEKELVFYGWWGEQYWKDAAQKFEEKYGIKVNVVIADNKVDKILAEKDNEVGTVDVQMFGGPNVRTVIDAGLLYGPIQPIIPDTDKLDPTLSKVQEGVQTNGYLVPIYRNQVGLLYNPEKVSNPPQTWEELQAFINENPKQFAFCDPNKGGTGEAMVQTVVANLTGGLDQYLTETELDPAKTAKYAAVWEWFNANMDKMTLTASNNESADTLNQGATSMVLAWDDDTQISFSKGTLFKEAKMYIPDFGLPGGGDTAGVIKNAPHKAAALLFINFLISSDMQKQMNETIGSYPARTDLTGLKALLLDEQRLKNGRPWYTSAYKKYGSEEFTKNVLMK